MKRYFQLVAVSLVLGCGAPQQQEAIIPQDVVRTVVQATDLEEGVNRADLSIKGMSCEMMCGGAIKKALAQVEGVESTEIDFDENEELDHAIVLYKEGVVNDAALIQAIAAIHDGAYQVQEVVVETNTASTVNGDSSSGGGGSDGNTSFGEELPEIRMPSLMDILSRIIRI